MSIFDKLKSTAQQAVNTAVSGAVQSIGSKTERFTFSALPESLAEMQALPEASLDTPFKTAALTVCALCAMLRIKKWGRKCLIGFADRALLQARIFHFSTTVSATERPIFRSLISWERPRKTAILRISPM